MKYSITLLSVLMLLIVSRKDKYIARVTSNNSNYASDFYYSKTFNTFIL